MTPPAVPAGTRTYARRSPMKIGTTVGLILVGAAAVAGSAVPVWATATLSDDLSGVRETTATGAQVAPALLPIAAAALAALGAVLAGRGVLRRVVGALVVLLGASAVALAVQGMLHPPVDVLVEDSVRSGISNVGLSLYGPVLAVVGGLAVASAGLPLAAGRTAARALGSRYERRSTSAASLATSGDPALMMWKELDADRDPTLLDDLPPGRDSLAGPLEGDRPDGRSTP